MVAQYKLEWLEVPGHGYLKCPLQAIFDAGVAHLVTAYSYVGTGKAHMNQGGYAYLEEDCDAGMVQFAMDLANIDYFEKSKSGNEYKLMAYTSSWRDKWARFRYDELKRFGFQNKPLSHEAMEELLENFYHLRK